MTVIAESRAFLISYDDFILGLKINQDLYQMQERLYAQKVAALKSAYEEKVRQLLASAESQGLVLELPELNGINADINLLPIVKEQNF